MQAVNNRIPKSQNISKCKLENTNFVLNPVPFWCFMQFRRTC